MEEPRSKNDIDLLEEEFYIIKVLAPENSAHHHDSDKMASFRRDVKISNMNSNKNECLKIFTCNDCNISFNKKSLLILHLKETHVEVKWTKLKLNKTEIDCDAAHGHKDIAKCGTNTLGSTDKMKYVCNKCNHWFCSAKQLEKHMYKSECRIYKCDKCSFTCFKQAHIASHIVKHAEKQLFSCSICEKAFKTKFHAAQHAQTHRISFPCDICSEVFDNLTKLRLHSTKHKHSVCDLCGFTCLDAVEFDNHKPCLNLDGKYVCTCGRRFTDSLLLKLHFIKEHSMESIYSCGSCNYITLDESILNKHISSHCNADFNEMHKCSECDYSTFYPSNLKKHKLKHNDKKPFQCSKCVLKLKSKKLLFQHEEIHKKDFKCSICKQIFQSLSKLKKHIFTHKGIKDIYNCSECGFISSTEIDLDMHKESHNDAKKYICDECGLRFKFPSFLKRHQKLHLRPVNVMFSCNQCSYCTMRIEAFKKHMQAIHQETVIVLFDDVEENVNKQHLCEICDYSTDRKSNLTAHIVTHIPLEERKRQNYQKDEKYFCNHCSYTSPSLINLRNHLRCHTNGEKFSCNKCSFTCKLLKYLKQHELTHMDRKPYLCDLCTRSFRKMRDLNKHMAVHKNINALQCDLCDYICLCSQGMKKHERIVHKMISNKNKCDNVKGLKINSDINDDLEC